MMVAWILSIFLIVKEQRRFPPLRILLTVSALIKLIVAWLFASNVELAWIYHIYSIFDYTLLYIYFMQLVSNLSMHQYEMDRDLSKNYSKSSTTLSTLFNPVVLF